MITRKNKLLYPLAPHENGPHVFGGQSTHRGATPRGATVPTHKLLTLDLNDPSLPFLSSKIRYLPLYYPLKYGCGGPSMQYEVVSDDEVKILYLSDPQPDPLDQAYVKVDSFPEVRYATQSPISNDVNIDWFTLTVGGEPTLDHKSDQCQNSACEYFQKTPNVELIAAIPPGEDDMWYEFQGAYMYFYFWLCRGCQTIMTSNRCT